MKTLRMVTWLVVAALSLVGGHATIGTALAAERPVNGKGANQIQKPSTAHALEVLDNGALSLNAEEVPLGHLMEEIHQKTGLEFTIHQSHLAHLVSTSFHSMPIEEAMKRILRGISYVLVFDSKGIDEVITLPSTGLPYEETTGTIPPPEQDAAWVSGEELKGRRDRLRAYFAKRRARLHVVDTTVTDSGQVIDWIRPESQVPGGRLASPPPKAFENSESETIDRPVPFELATQPHARGPKGTVPVLRRDVDSVINNLVPPERIEDFLGKYGHAGAISNPNAIADPGDPKHVYAFSAQYVDSFGSHGNINLWDPYVYKSDEFSLGQVGVARENGGGPMQTIEAGWQDYKNLYGDYYPHFFIFYTTNGYSSKGDNVGGYNRDVDGWVQNSSTVFPGARITQQSTYGGTQYSMHTRVQLYNGNWWIRIFNEWVGYYPASLFASNGLRNKADKISWFGEVVDLDDKMTTYTDMGSGSFASHGWQSAAYMRNIWYYDLETGNMYKYNPDTIWASNSGCYSIDGHFLSNSAWESYFWWGGPGKCWRCP